MDAVTVELCLLGLAVGLAFFAQSVTGFGAVLIALTLGALVFPLQQLVPVMIALTFPHSFYLLSRYHAQVDWPLRVYGLSRHGLEKGAFRATLLVLWPTLNAALMGYFLYAGRWTAWSTTTFLWMLPPLAVGIVLGDFLHHRISERQFTLVLQGLLLLSGLGLLSK